MENLSNYSDFYSRLTPSNKLFKDLADTEAARNFFVDKMNNAVAQVKYDDDYALEVIENHLKFWMDNFVDGRSKIIAFVRNEAGVHY